MEALENERLVQTNGEAILIVASEATRDMPCKLLPCHGDRTCRQLFHFLHFTSIYLLTQSDRESRNAHSFQFPKLTHRTGPNCFSPSSKDRYRYTSHGRQLRYRSNSTHRRAVRHCGVLHPGTGRQHEISLRQRLPSKSPTAFGS